MQQSATVPIDRRPIIQALEPNPRCVHCSRPLLRVISSKHPDPEIEVDRNALGELIAWCACQNCGKISPLLLA